MTSPSALRVAARRALLGADADELNALGILVRQLKDPTFRQAVVTELADELAARAPTATRAIEEARASADGNERVACQLLSERLDHRENPARTRLAARLLVRCWWLSCA